MYLLFREQLNWIKVLFVRLHWLCYSRAQAHTHTYTFSISVCARRSANTDIIVECVVRCVVFSAGSYRKFWPTRKCSLLWEHTHYIRIYTNIRETRTIKFISLHLLWHPCLSHHPDLTKTKSRYTARSLYFIDKCRLCFVSFGFSHKAHASSFANSKVRIIHTCVRISMSESRGKHRNNRK